MYIPTYATHPCCNTTMNVKKHISEIVLMAFLINQSYQFTRRDAKCTKKESLIATCYRCIETEYRGFSTPRIAYNNDMRNDKEELQN